MFLKLAYGLLVGPEDVQVYDLRGEATAASLPSVKEAMQVAGRGKGRVAIVVSDAHSRYLVMQRPQAVRHRGELIAAMRQRFDAMFGDARRWALRHHASPSAQSDVVVGMDADLLEHMGAEAQAAGVTVASIRPHWTAWASRLRRETRRGDHWIITSHAAWASVGASKRSLMPTTSMSFPRIARKARRPIRPKPLMPTLTAMCPPADGAM